MFRNGVPVRKFKDYKFPASAESSMPGTPSNLEKAEKHDVEYLDANGSSQVVEDKNAIKAAHHQQVISV